MGSDFPEPTNVDVECVYAFNTNLFVCVCVWRASSEKWALQDQVLLESCGIAMMEKCFCLIFFRMNRCFFFYIISIFV